MAKRLRTQRRPRGGQSAGRTDSSKPKLGEGKQGAPCLLRKGPITPEVPKALGGRPPTGGPAWIKGRERAWAPLLCILQEMCGSNPGGSPLQLDWGPGLECLAKLDPSLLQLGTVSPRRLPVPRWGPGAAERARPGTHSISREVRGRCSAGQGQL